MRSKSPHPPRPKERHPERRPERRPDRPRAGGGAPWLFGTHAVLAALANPERRCRRLVLTAEAERSLGPVLAGAEAAGGRRPSVELMEREAIARLLPPGAVHQGVALLADPLEPAALEEIVMATADAAHATVVVLDQVTDPHNIGAVLRSAAAFDAAAVIVTERHAPEATGTLAKAASGALETVPLARVVNLARALADLKAAGFWCVGLDGTAERSLAAAKPDGKVALVLGSEGEGLRRLTRETCDILARLPIDPRMESLNVSNAAAVALYELTRDRNRT